MQSGYWPLFRYNPALRGTGQEPVPARLEGAGACRSRSTSTTRPATPCSFTAIRRPRPTLLVGAQEDVKARWKMYEHMAAMPAKPTEAKRAGLVRPALITRETMIDLSTEVPGIQTGDAAGGVLQPALQGCREHPPAWPMRASAPSSCTPSSRSRSTPSRLTSTGCSRRASRHGEAQTYFPDMTQLQHRTGRLPRAHPQAEARHRRSGHRQPQRRVARRLAPLREAHGAGRSRRPSN